jgi:hypothetical protein
MKKWAWVVALLYGAMIVVLTFPAAVALFGDHLKESNAFSLQELEGVFFHWPYWLGLVFFIVAQVALLAVPVRVSEKRPVNKRSVVFTVAASALMIGLLGSGLWLALSETLRGEAFLDNEIWWWSALGIFAVTWVFWAAIFYRWSKKLSAANLIEKICHYLFRGSILELLVAVPTHIAARNKAYCCAGFGTFWGIAFGMAVMIFSFGPGVFFLFVQRWDRLHPKKEDRI